MKGLKQVIRKLHEEEALAIYVAIMDGAKSVADIEGVLSHALQQDLNVIKEYLNAIGDENIVDVKWNSGTNYVESVKAAVERVREKLEEIFPLYTGEELAEAIAEEYERKMNYEIARIFTTEKTRIEATAVITTCSYYRYESCRDNKTCPYCLALDNQVFDTYDAEIGVNMPPMHSNCRCRVIPL